MSLPWRSVARRFPGNEVRTAETLAREDEFRIEKVGPFLWILFFFKVATILAIYWAAGGSSEAGILLSATQWIWLIIPGIVVFGGLAFRYRLRRVRARRLELQRSEWMLDEHETVGAAVRPHDRDL
jgi:hypothetical protein